MKRANFIFNNLGNIVAITAKTPKALTYLKDNLSTESWQWFGNTVHIEARWFGDIDAGLFY